MNNTNVWHITNKPKTELCQTQLRLLQLANCNFKFQEVIVKLGLGRFIFPMITVEEPLTLWLTVKQKLDIETYGEITIDRQRYIRR